MVSQFADIVAIRAFADLKDKEKDEAEIVINGFVTHASIPVVNMESSVGHPLQALADAITLAEHNTKTTQSGVVLGATPKALPHAVGNSFVQMMQKQDADFVITNPEGYNLDPRITKGTPIIHNQEEALQDADFVYVKNWSSYEDYGQVANTDENWNYFGKTRWAKFMHCLPVRRNVVVADEVLDSNQSLVIAQANNRTLQRN